MEKYLLETVVSLGYCVRRKSRFTKREGSKQIDLSKKKKWHWFNQQFQGNPAPHAPPPRYGNPYGNAPPPAFGYASFPPPNTWMRPQAPAQA
jgi:hypothetical protein